MTYPVGSQRSPCVGARYGIAADRWHAARRKLPDWGLLLWNVGGLALLLNIVVVAMLSTPPLQRFDSTPANTIIAHAPFVWQPTVLVQAALLGQLLVFRRLWSQWRSRKAIEPGALRRAA